MAKLRVGDPLDKSMDMGAVIAPVQKNEFKNSLIKVKKRAEIWQWQGTLPKNGCFFLPHIDKRCSSINCCAKEIFGPVLSSPTFRTPDEAVMSQTIALMVLRQVFGASINQSLHLAPKLKVGVVWINCTNQFDASVGFEDIRKRIRSEGGTRASLSTSN